jgi:hypothetical protein
MIIGDKIDVVKTNLSAGEWNNGGTALSVAAPGFLTGSSNVNLYPIIHDDEPEIVVEEGIPKARKIDI